MSHHWLHLAHAASHIIKHLVDHSKKHAATTEHAAPPALRCSRCTVTTDIKATNCCNVYLCTTCVEAWATATLRNGSQCVICAQAAVRQATPPQ